jgi:hypothetical protein
LEAFECGITNLASILYKLKKMGVAIVNLHSGKYPPSGGRIWVKYPTPPASLSEAGDVRIAQSRQ